MHRNRARLFTSLVMSFLYVTAGAGDAFAQAPFSLGGVTAAPGTLASGELTVPAGAVWQPAAPGDHPPPAPQCSQSGRSSSKAPRPSMTAPLSSLSLRPARSVSLRLPSAMTAVATISESSAR